MTPKGHFEINWPLGFYSEYETYFKVRVEVAAEACVPEFNEYYLHSDVYIATQIRFWSVFCSKFGIAGMPGENAKMWRMFGWRRLHTNDKK